MYCTIDVNKFPSTFASLILTQFPRVSSVLLSFCLLFFPPLSLSCCHFTVPMFQINYFKRIFSKKRISFCSDMSCPKKLQDVSFWRSDIPSFLACVQTKHHPG